MKLKNFCIVGVDPDLDEFILENKKNYLGLITNFEEKKYIYSSKRLGKESISDWKNIKKKFDPDVLIVVDQGKLREKLKKKIYKNNVKNLISSESNISQSTLKNINKKKGIIINKFAYISSRVKLNDGIKIHVSAQIHHDVFLGKYVTIAPRATILGSVKVDDYSYIGAGSIIKQGVKIGKNCVIGAGAVVLKNISNNSTVVGNPGKVIK